MHAAYQLQVAEVDAIRPSLMARNKLHKIGSSRPLSPVCSTVSTADTSDPGDDFKTHLPPINPKGQRQRRCSDCAVRLPRRSSAAGPKASPNRLAIPRPASSPHHSKFREGCPNHFAVPRPSSSPHHSKHNGQAQMPAPRRKLPGEPYFASTPECSNIKVEWFGESMDMKHECSVCCDDLCNRSVVLLLDENGQRSCPHFLHSQCCHVIEQRAKAFGDVPFCPVCQVPFSGFVSIPKPFEDPENFYAALDVAGCGNVSRSEVVAALQATTNVNPRWIEKSINPLGSNTGSISPKECEALLLHVEENFKAKAEKEKVPSLQQRHAWFNYWDKDGTGLLTQEEVTRALLKTLREFDAFRIHEAVANIWPEVDEFDSGLVDSDRVLCAGSGLLDRVIKYASASPGKDKWRRAVFDVMSSNNNQQAKASGKRHASCPTGARQK